MIVAIGIICILTLPMITGIIFKCCRGRKKISPDSLIM